MSKPAEIKEPAKFKFLKKTVKTSEPVNNRLVNIINTLWQQKVPLYKLKYEIAKFDPPRNCNKLATKLCNKELWNNPLHKRHRNIQRVQKAIVKGSIALGQITDKLVMLSPEKNDY